MRTTYKIEDKWIQDKNVINYVLKLMLVEFTKEEFNSGLCYVLCVLEAYGQISNKHYILVRDYLRANRPKDAEHPYWYKINKNGRQRRLDWLNEHIQLTS